MRKTALFIVLAIVAASGYLLVVSGDAQAQEQRNFRRPPTERMSPDEMAERMAQFRQRMLQNVRERLGFSEEEWTAVEPMYLKVTGLQRQVETGMNMRMLGGFGRRGGDRGDDRGGDRNERTRPDPFGIPGVENNEALAKAREQLNTVVEQDNASAESLSRAVAAYRLARGEVEKQLEQARAELKSILSARQEAQLVAWGVLR